MMSTSSGAAFALYVLTVRLAIAVAASAMVLQSGLLIVEFWYMDFRGVAVAGDKLLVWRSQISRKVLQPALLCCFVLDVDLWDTLFVSVE